MKWLRNLLKGISLTGALFVFQACYGTPVSYEGPDGETAYIEEAIDALDPDASLDNPEGTEPEAAPEGIQ